MREILFKAKRVDNNEWVEGHYYYDLESMRHYITCKDPRSIVKAFGIKKETVCQFTGLLDNNCNKIFEGDIVNGDYVVEFKDGCFWVCCMSEEDNNLLFDYEEELNLEITSNIHD